MKDSYVIFLIIFSCLLWKNNKQCSKCLFCPDISIPSCFKWLMKTTDWHHINKRRNSDYVIPVCRYHHTLIEQNKIDKQVIVDKANKYYGDELFYLPYPESKHIQVKEIYLK